MVTRDLYDMIYSNIKIPIVFDYHHHQFCTGGQTNKRLCTCCLYLGRHRPSSTLFSITLRRAQRPINQPQAHSDSYWSVPELYEYQCGCHARVQTQRARLTENATTNYRRSIKWKKSTTPLRPKKKLSKGQASMFTTYVTVMDTVESEVVRKFKKRCFGK